MAEKYIARYGKVWKDRRTGDIVGAELELKDDESIKSYTQTSAEESRKSNTEPTRNKKEKSTAFFKEEAEY